MNNKLNIFALIATIIFHAIIALILFMFGFITPLPLPEEQGIMIAFGDTDTGLGNTQASLATEVKSDKVNASIPENRKNISSPSNNDKILTQDFEEAPSIKSSEKNKTKKKEVKLLTEKQKRDRKEASEKTRKERIEKERINRENAEKRRLEEAQIAAENARQAKIANINRKAKSTFGRKDGDDSGNSGNSSGNGNMGKPQGSLEGDYNGTGKGNSGVSYSLEGRSATVIVKPSSSFQKSGKVVVSIFVNTEGKVTRAVAGARGTTTHDMELHKLAETAAMQTSFNTDSNAAATQKGTMTYIFIVK